MSQGYANCYLDRQDNVKLSCSIDRALWGIMIAIHIPLLYDRTWLQ